MKQAVQFIGSSVYPYFYGVYMDPPHKTRICGFHTCLNFTSPYLLETERIYNQVYG